MPYIVMSYPDQPIPSRLPLYRNANSERKSATPTRHARCTQPREEGSALLGLFCAILFDLIVAAMALGLWEILNHI